MSEAKYTPGPWSTHNVGDVELLVVDDDRNIIADLSGSDCDEQADANACLIASAPALLHHCKTLVALAERRGRLDEYAAALKDASAVIAKAEGTNMETSDE